MYTPSGVVRIFTFSGVLVLRVPVQGLISRQQAGVGTNTKVPRGGCRIWLKSEPTNQRGQTVVVIRGSTETNHLDRGLRFARNGISAAVSINYFMEAKDSCFIFENQYLNSNMGMTGAFRDCFGMYWEMGWFSKCIIQTLFRSVRDVLLIYSINWTKISY